MAERHALLEPAALNCIIGIGSDRINPMILAERRPETPTVTITNHAEYRVALERIGQLEDLRRISECESLELNAMRAAIEDYHSLSGSSCLRTPALLRGVPQAL